MFNINTKTLNKIKPIYLFVILYLIFTLFYFLIFSVWGHSLFKYKSIFVSAFSLICYICIIFNIFVYKVYTLKKFIIHLILTIIVFVVSHHMNNPYVCYLWFYLISIPPVNFTKISKTVIGITSIIVATIVLLVFMGYGESVAMLRPATPILRYYYGFVDPNIFGGALLQICMALVYIRWKNLKFIDNLFMLSTLCITYFFAHSRTSAILIFLLIVLANYGKKLQEEKAVSISNVTANSLIVLCPAITFIITYMYRNSYHIALWIDDLVSYRFRNLCYCLATIPVDFFGSELKISSDLMVLHNLYGILLVNYGIFIFILFLAACVMITRKAYKKQNIPILIIIILSLIQGISENFFVGPQFNFAFLIFSSLLNNNKLFEEES